MDKSEAMSLIATLRTAGNASEAATLTAAIFGFQHSSAPATPENNVNLYHEVANLVNKPH